MEARNQRMLEELLKIPGNDNCADCHASAPRWASVNLGIFLCVGCASVHRKMGTHKSRVRSVTLDTWSREQISHMRNMGNVASNQIWNPNEALHPPPSSLFHEERDSEIEKYIRRKYEQGAFKGGAAARLDGRPRSQSQVQGYEPTSLNRARERDGRIPAMGTGWGNQNSKNPELNDIVLPRQREERDLPPLPPGSGSRSPAPPRARPTRSSSNQNITSASSWSNPPTSSNANSTPASSQYSYAQNGTMSAEANLIDMSRPAASSTLPLQVNMANSNSSGVGQMNGYLSAQSGYSSCPTPGNMMNGAGVFGSSPQGMYGNQLSPQPTFGQQLSPQNAYGQHVQQQIPPQVQGGGYSQFSSTTPSPSFVSTGTFGSSPAIQTPQGYGQSPSPAFAGQSQQAQPFQQQAQGQYQQQQQQQYNPQQQQYMYQQQQQPNGANMGYTHQPYAAPKPPPPAGPASWNGQNAQMGMGMGMGMGAGAGAGVGGYGNQAYGMNGVTGYVGQQGMGMGMGR